MVQILWLRNDLRLHDHEGFRRAIANGDPLAVVYILPMHWLDKDRYGMTRLGGAKARFLRASLIDLHRQLEDQTIDFHIYCGDPVDTLLAIKEELAGEDFQLLTSEAQAPEELNWLSRLKKCGVNTQTYSAQTLFNSEQMSELLDDFPDSFSKFRRIVEKYTHQYSVPQDISSPRLQIHEYPLKHRAPVSWPDISERLELPFTGGERPAQQWLKDYIWDSQSLSHYKQTRNQLLGRHNFSHMSSYLAWGCLSPRQLWHETLKFEAAHHQGGEPSEDTYWLRFELLWREYFHWSLRAHGSALFSAGGIQKKDRKYTHNAEYWQAWCEARTGIPMVDAGLRELRQSGFVSNRLRQNMASYFIHQLKLDWRLGARWFEMYLTDFDVASNYGNWAYIAGVGHDPRPVREFNLNGQLRQYDPKLTHIKQWCPEVTDANLNDVFNHQNGEVILPSFPPPVISLPQHSAQPEQ